MELTQLPKVAVLLAAYNGEKYIYEQIESIINQAGVDVKVYISIDSSTDKTLEICKNFQKKHKNIFIINEGNERFGSAGKNFYYLIKNLDLEEFDFISLSDQDDIWKSSKIIRGIQVLEKEKASGYSSDVECFWDNKSRKNKIIKKSYPQKKYDYYFEPAGPGCTYILSKNFFIELKKYIDKNNQEMPFHHDWFIYAYARVNNYKWIIDSSPNILYRQHKDNQVGANFGIKAIISRIQKIRSGEFRNHFMEIYKFSSTYNEKKYSIKSLSYSIKKNPFEYRRNKKEAILLYFLFLLKII